MGIQPLALLVGVPVTEDSFPDLRPEDVGPVSAVAGAKLKTYMPEDETYGRSESASVKKALMLLKEARR